MPSPIQNPDRIRVTADQLPEQPKPSGSLGCGLLIACGVVVLPVGLLLLSHGRIKNREDAIGLAVAITVVVGAAGIWLWRKKAAVAAACAERRTAIIAGIERAYALHAGDQSKLDRHADDLARHTAAMRAAITAVRPIDFVQAAQAAITTLTLVDVATKLHAVRVADVNRHVLAYGLVVDPLPERLTLPAAHRQVMAEAAQVIEDGKNVPAISTVWMQAETAASIKREIAAAEQRTQEVLGAMAGKIQQGNLRLDRLRDSVDELQSRINFLNATR